MAHLRTLAGIESATPQQINPGGTSYVLVTYRGEHRRSSPRRLAARGWIVEITAATSCRMRSASGKPPPLPPPPPPPQPPAASRSRRRSATPPATAAQ